MSEWRERAGLNKAPYARGWDDDSDDASRIVFRSRASRNVGETLATHADPGQGDGVPVILAGPTCDSSDILYRRHPYELPLDLAVGDRIEFLTAGAYTASYAAVEFNGFRPVRTYCV